MTKTSPVDAAELARWRREPFAPVSLRVRCRGEMHTLARSANGQLALLDHSPKEIDREGAFAELGGEPAECVRIFALWRNKLGSRAARRVTDLPPALRAPAAEAIAVRDQRRARPRPADPLDVPCFRRPGLVGRLLSRLLHRRCGVPQGVTVLVSPESPGPGAATSFGVAFVSGGARLFRTFIAATWVEDVYRRGLALFDGSLTLSARQPREPHAHETLKLTCCRPVRQGGAVRFAKYEGQGGRHETA
jgi:hypothetical protein